MLFRHHTRPLFALLAVALLTAGCGKDWKLEVESNTSWSGSYGTVSVDGLSEGDVQGSGSRSFDLPDDDRVCCAFTQTGNGYLHVKIKDEGGGLFHMFAEDERSAETNVNGGLADLCTEGTLP